MLNGALIQTVMASRVLYGMSRRGALPRWLGRVHPRTGTPVASTVLCVVLIGALSTTLPIVTLAEAASMVTLVIFAFVDFALLRIKLHGSDGPQPPFVIPVWLPAFGMVASLALLGFGLW